MLWTRSLTALLDGGPAAVGAHRDRLGLLICVCISSAYCSALMASELEPISWQEWFKKFDREKLALLYQEEKASGEDSTFFKLVRR